MGQSCLPVHLQPAIDRRGKIRHFDPLDKGEDHINNVLEHNAAVDYAIRKNQQRENYFVLELMMQCNNLPNVSHRERASTFAILEVDINSLDDHDKIVIGCVQEEELDRYENVSEESYQSVRTEDYVSEWVVKRTTEIQNDETDPIYKNTFIFNSQNQAAMRFRILIYQVKKRNIDVIKREEAELIGEAEFLIGEMLKKRKEGLIQPLMNYDSKKVNNQLQELKTTCTLRYEQIEQTNTTVNMQIMVKGYGAAFLMYKILIIREMSDFVVVYTSKRQKNDFVTGARWEPHNIYMKELCRNDPTRQLRLEIYEWKRVKGTVWQFFVSEMLMTVNELNDSIGKYQPMYKDKLAHGKMKCTLFDKSYQFQFIDYIHGGCDISVSVAMDFSLANLHYNNPQSLHYIPKSDEKKSNNQENGLNTTEIVQKSSIKTTTRVEQMIKKTRAAGQQVKNKKRRKQIEEAISNQKKVYMNEYQEALYMTMSVMEAYDKDMMIPFLGFGAKLPPYYNVASSCFAVNGNIFMPECHGTQGLLDCYAKNIVKFQPHGPIAYSQIIDFATQFIGQEPVTQENQFYSILIIITNGSNQDKQATIDKIVESSDYPISIIIVTVGDADISGIRILDGDKGLLVHSNNFNGEWRAARDMVQFVPYRKYKFDYKGFARELLAEIANNIKDYFVNRKIYPNARKIEMAGNPQGRQKIELEKNGEERKDIILEEEQKLEVFQNKLLNQHQKVYMKELKALGFEEFDIQIMIEKGIASLDKSLAVEQLAVLHKDAKIRMMKDRQRREAQREKIKLDKEKAQAELAVFGDMKQIFNE